MHKASSISNFFIAFLHEHGDPLSNLKLQKLLYYAQAWHLAIFDKPLFGESIEAWVQRASGSFQSTAASRDGHGNRFKRIPKCLNLTEPVRQHLNEIMDVYGGMTAYQLEQLTHSEEPWLNARNGIPVDESSNA